MAFMTFHSVGNFIIPTDELIFFRGVGTPPTRIPLLVESRVIPIKFYGKSPWNLDWEVCSCWFSFGFGQRSGLYLQPQPLLPWCERDWIPICGGFCSGFSLVNHRCFPMKSRLWWWITHFWQLCSWVFITFCPQICSTLAGFSIGLILFEINDMRATSSLMWI